MKEADRQIIALLAEIESNGGGSGGGAVSDDTKADKTVAGKYRIKTDGTFQLYNGTTSKYHTLTISGADGALVINIAAGEA